MRQIYEIYLKYAAKQAAYLNKVLHPNGEQADIVKKQFIFKGK